MYPRELWTIKGSDESRRIKVSLRAAEGIYPESSGKVQIKGEC